jgi:hypothetical protein
MFFISPFCHSALRDENSRLMDQLADAQLELRELRKLKTSATDFVIPGSADQRERKILELAKKVF